MTRPTQTWDDQKVVELSRKLNRELPTTGGWIVVRDGPDDTLVEGDRLGFLRLGAAMIEGATRPLGTEIGIQNCLDVGVDDLFGGWVVTFQCREDQTADDDPWPRPPQRANAAVSVGCGLIALGLLALIAIGGYTVFVSF